jgi:uncharacterized protein
MNIVPVARATDGRRKIAVIGSGIAGSSAAWALARNADVTLYEAESRPGGHTATVDIDYRGTAVSVDTGFIVYNERNYPELTNLFATLGVDTHPSDMGFSLSLDDGRLEWSGHNFRTLFAQKRNAVSPTFLWMLREIVRFNRCCVADRDSGRLAGLTIGAYLDRRKFSAAFRDNYLIPMAAAIWSTPRIEMLAFPAATFVTFFENHRLIHTDRPIWRTVTGGARTYLDRLLAPLAGRVRTGAAIETIIRDAFGATVWARGAEPERYDAVVVATHSDQALALLGDASAIERTVLSAISYRPNRVVLHRDPRLMPKRKGVWAAWNYLRTSDDADREVCVTYWMNRLQGIDARLPLFVSLNPTLEPREELTFGEWSYAHPQFDTGALTAQSRLGEIQGVRNTWFAGAWTGYGFHEDGLRSGLDAAEGLGAKVPWRRPHAAERDMALAAE